MKRFSLFMLVVLSAGVPFAQDTAAELPAGATAQKEATLGGHTWGVRSVFLSPDGSAPGKITTHRPDELIGTWEAVSSGDGVDTTSVLELLADGRITTTETITSHESMKESLVNEWGADPDRIQFVADSLAERRSRFHGALAADRQVFIFELAGTWGVEGNAIQAVVDSFSLSLNGLQGNDVVAFYEDVFPLVVPAENAGFVDFLVLGIALIQGVFDALVETGEVFEFGVYSTENDMLVVVNEEGTVRYSRASDAMAADFDGDGTVGLSDFLQFAAKFGLSRDDVGYDGRFDLDGDGTVGLSDFLIFAASFGHGT